MEETGGRKKFGIRYTVHGHVGQRVEPCSTGIVNGGLERESRNVPYSPNYWRGLAR